jgi:hypothetical protein
VASEQLREDVVAMVEWQAARALEIKASTEAEAAALMTAACINIQKLSQRREDAQSVCGSSLDLAICTHADRIGHHLSVCRPPLEIP